MIGPRPVLACLIALTVSCSNPQASQPAAPEAAPSAIDRAGLARYLALAAKAEAIEDRVERCRAYPDLPNNAWPPGSALAMCSLLIEPALSLTGIGDLLAAKGGEAVDRYFAAALEDAEPGHGAIFRAYEVFNGGEESRDIVERWLSLSPESAFAKLAVARTYLAAGWDSRGTAYIGKTSSDRITQMMRWFDRAQPLFEQALEANPALSPACVGLISISRNRGNDELLRSATAACDRADGSSWYVFSARQFAAEQKWGGTQAMRQSLVDDVMARMAVNPALASYLASVDAEQPSALASAGRWQEAAPGLERAAIVSPNASWLGSAGVAAHKLGQEDKAIVYLSQALRFAPDSVRYREMRAAARMQTGDHQGAMSDLQRIVASGKAKGYTYSQLGRLLHDAGQVPEAKAAFRHAMESPDQRLWAFRKWCEIIITREHDVDAALACSEGLVTEYSEDTEALFMRAWVLTENKQEGADDFAKRFYAQANPADGRQAQMLQQLRQLRDEQ